MPNINQTADVGDAGETTMKPNVISCVSAEDVKSEIGGLCVVGRAHDSGFPLCPSVSCWAHQVCTGMRRLESSRAEWFLVEHTTKAWIHMRNPDKVFYLQDVLVGSWHFVEASCL